jgi:hypothetical protein
MASTARITVEIEDVKGSFRRLIDDAPKRVRKYMATAVFQTSMAVLREMEARAAMGPEGEGLTPDEHIKLDLTHQGRVTAMSQRVGIFDNAGQAAVALFNEYSPDHQPFMKPAAEAEAGPFLARAIEALQKVERELSGTFTT